jgi:hypothetical protein
MKEGNVVVKWKTKAIKRRKRTKDETKEEGKKRKSKEGNKEVKT